MTFIILLVIIGFYLVFYFTKYSSLFGVIGSIVSLVGCAMYIDKYGLGIMNIIPSLIWIISLVLWVAIYIKKN